MSFRYSGDELPLMAGAVRWKHYLADLVRPHLGASVLEVGAGIGSNIPYLYHPPVRHWTALEPDPTQAARIDGPGIRVIVGTIADVGATDRFDIILYLDVLEHIADDRGELRRAAQHLTPGGRLIVLAPAHPFLFGAMDAAIGHHRRYTATTLRALTPAGCDLEQVRQIDVMGYFAMLGHRLLRRGAQPTAVQIRLWDGCFVPVSRRLDRCLGYRLGKSLFAIWRRT